MIKPKIIFTGTVPNIKIKEREKAFQKNGSFIASA